MWQTVVVLFVIAAVLIYVIRHYVRILRGKTPICCECSGCCAPEMQDGCECSGELGELIKAKEAGPAGRSQKKEQL